MPEKSLGHIGEIFAGKAATRLRPGSDEVPILTMRNIGDALHTSGEMDIVLVDMRDTERFTVRAGDLVASVRGAFRVAVVDPEHAGAIAGANTAVIRLLPDVPAVVVAAYLRHPDVTHRLMQAFVGSTVPGISLEDLRDTPLVLPAPKLLHHLAHLIETGEAYYSAMREAAEKRRDLALELVMQTMNREISPA